MDSAIYPQPLVQSERFAHLDFLNFFLQRMDSVLKREHTKAAVDSLRTAPLFAQFRSN